MTRASLFLLLCIASPSFAQSAPTCGDGEVQSSEECDDGNENSDTLQNHCRSTCTLPRCGDGVQDISEQCDDGNTSDGDVCSSDCSESYLGKSSYHSSDTIVVAGELEPDVALRRAVLTTFLGPPGLGLLYGPSMGHFYAGEVGRGLGMTLARTATVGAVFVIQSATVSQKISLDTSIALTILSGLTLNALIAADLIDAPRAAQRANTKKRAASQE